MELTVGAGDSVNGIKRLKNDSCSYLSVLIMYKYPSLSLTLVLRNYEDAPQDTLINKMRESCLGFLHCAVRGCRGL